MTSIHMIGKMPELPKSPPPIFTLPTPRVSEKALLSLARTLRLKGNERTGAISRDASTFTYAEGAYQLTLHRASGAFRLKDRNRWQVDHRSNAEFSDQDAIKLARAELRRYKLLPEESKVLRVSRLHVATAGPDRVMQDHRIVDVAVCFQAIIRGIPTDGAGGNATVYLDHEGKLTCVDHTFRRVGSEYRKVTQLRTPEHAVDEATRMWDKRGVGVVEISEVRLCYYELGWNDEQRYLQPAYYILAALIGPDKRIKTGDIYVTPAAMNDAGRIVRLPPRRVAQSPREADRSGNRPTRRRQSN
jgi:hypothetical protein